MYKTKTGEIFWQIKRKVHLVLLERRGKLKKKLRDFSEEKEGGKGKAWVWVYSP